MSYLDDLKGKTIAVNGVPVPDRKRLNIISSGSSVTDNAVTGTTDLSLIVADYEITSGFSVIGKSTTGAGLASEIVFGANTTLMRNASGNVAAETINTQKFLEGTTVTKAGYWASEEFINVLTDGFDQLDVDLGTAPLGNGSYRFTVSVSATQGANTYDWDYTLRAKRTAGTLAGAGLAAPTADAANDSLPAGITIVLSNASGNLNVLVDNATANTWHFTVSVALVYVPYPVAP